MRRATVLAFGWRFFPIARNYFLLCLGIGSELLGRRPLADNRSMVNHHLQ
jgi:hypothetical protein